MSLFISKSLDLEDPVKRNLKKTKNIDTERTGLEIFVVELDGGDMRTALDSEVDWMRIST